MFGISLRMQQFAIFQDLFRLYDMYLFRALFSGFILLHVTIKKMSRGNEF